ncbi:MAG: hypothetical protein ACOCSD_08585 [Halolamina sp.]
MTEADTDASMDEPGDGVDAPKVATSAVTTAMRSRWGSASASRSGRRWGR